MSAFPWHAGSLELPEGWELRVQLSVKEPAGPAPSLPRGKPALPAPCANIVIHRRIAEAHETASGILQALLEELRRSSPTVRASATADFEFEDGTRGVRLDLDIPVGAQLEMRQRHVVRIDGQIVSHLTATAPSNAAGKLVTLSAALRSFRP